MSRSREFSAVCQPPVISVRTRSQFCARLGGRERQTEPVEQQPRDPLLLAQHRAPGRFGRMRGEHRLDPDLDHEAADLFERRAPAPCSRVTRLDDAARLRRAFVQILAAAADAMDFLGHVDHFEPHRERAHQVARLRGRDVPRAGRQLAGALGVAVAPRDRGLPIRSTASNKASPPCSRNTSPTRRRARARRRAARRLSAERKCRSEAWQGCESARESSRTIVRWSK